MSWVDAIQQENESHWQWIASVGGKIILRGDNIRRA
jgi:hypothetical protein